MILDPVHRQRRIVGLALIALGAAVAAFALAHMAKLAAYGPICGGASPHCPACPAALALFAAGGLLLLSSATQSAPARTRR